MNLVSPGRYSHEVWMQVGDGEYRKYDRPEKVFAFSAANVKEE